ncbi:hypothetical protein LptCag_2224 [Leptospirillum ferriphilum]|uniref:Uncharacterized protein n=1 Tax=Leptospirillum ferriphilum TaxID=178606 RepID=A0A094WE33_9BACT|nr:hypothetical protein LptCag_2224 [Leptospirillum ferriphilum]
MMASHGMGSGRTSLKGIFHDNFRFLRELPVEIKGDHRMDRITDKCINGKKRPSSQDGRR